MLKKNIKEKFLSFMSGQKIIGAITILFLLAIAALYVGINLHIISIIGATSVIILAGIYSYNLYKKNHRTVIELKKDEKQEAETKPSKLKTVSEKDEAQIAYASKQVSNHEQQPIPEDDKITEVKSSTTQTKMPVRSKHDQAIRDQFKLVISKSLEKQGNHRTELKPKILLNTIKEQSKLERQTNNNRGESSNSVLVHEKNGKKTPSKNDRLVEKDKISETRIEQASTIEVSVIRSNIRLINNEGDREIAEANIPAPRNDRISDREFTTSESPHDELEFNANINKLTENHSTESFCKNGKLASSPSDALISITSENPCEIPQNFLIEEEPQLISCDSLKRDENNKLTLISSINLGSSPNVSENLRALLEGLSNMRKIIIMDAAEKEILNEKIRNLEEEIKQLKLKILVDAVLFNIESEEDITLQNSDLEEYAGDTIPQKLEFNVESESTTFQNSNLEESVGITTPQKAKSNVKSEESNNELNSNSFQNFVNGILEKTVNINQQKVSAFRVAVSQQLVSTSKIIVTTTDVVINKFNNLAKYTKLSTLGR